MNEQPPIFDPLTQYQQIQVAGIDTWIAAQPLVLVQPPNNTKDVYVWVDPDKSLVVYGDTVTIRGELNLPGMDVTIAARVLIGEVDDRDMGPAIITTGPDGAGGGAQLPKPPQAAPGYTPRNYAQRPGGTGGVGAAGAPGASGGDAGRAGSVTLALGEYQGPALRFEANGGAGGDGAVGQPGGDGGDGGSGSYGAASETVVDGRVVFSSISCGDGGAGGSGGTGGQGGNGGNGGNGGAVLVTGLTKSTMPMDSEVSTTGGAGGSGGASGLGGNGGAGGRGGEFDGLGNRVSYCDSGPYGADGGSAQSDSVDGSTGADGTESWTIVDPSDATFLDQAVHVGQLSMALERAKIFYLTADPTAPDPATLAEVHDILTWIVTVTGSLPVGFTYTDQLTRMNHEASALLRQMSLGLNFFGQRSNDVPLVSYAEASQAFTALSTVFDDIHTSFMTYFASLEKTQTESETLQSSLRSLESHVTTIEAQASHLETSMNPLAAEIDSLQDECEAQLVVVQNEFDEQVQQKIVQYYSCKTIEDLITGLGMLVATDPTDQTYAKLIDEGASTGVTTVSTERKYMIERLDTIDGSLASIQHGYSIGSSSITEDDPNAYKLLLAQKQIDQALAPLNNYAATKQAEQDLAHYVALVQQRNQLIATYNQTANAIAGLNAQANRLRDQEAEINSVLAAKSNPTTSYVYSYMSQVYQNIREGLLRQMYDTTRAYYFWALRPRSLYDLIGFDQLGTVTPTDVASAQKSLIELVYNAIEGSGTPPQTFKDISFSLDAPVIKRLKETVADGAASAYFAIPVVTPTSTPGPGFPTSYTEIRLGEAIGTAVGATASDDRITLTMTQLGTETIVSRTGTEVTFRHETVTEDITYNTQTGVYEAKANFGALTGTEAQSNYQPIGPFALWRLRVSGADLDLADLKAVKFTFSGTFQAYEDDLDRGEP